MLSMRKARKGTKGNTRTRNLPKGIIIVGQKAVQEQEICQKQNRAGQKQSELEIGTSITMNQNSISRWWSKWWHLWDVRVMVLISLTIQVILFFLGSRRKNTVKIWLRMVLWFAYLIADWIATTALGNLSRAQGKTDPINILRALWAPMLLLHLGGPDTITAYVLEDNSLWKRHLLGLVVQSSLVIHVLVLSRTWSWFSHVMNYLMFIAGLLKYAERTWTLVLASSGEAKGTVPVFQIDTPVTDRDKKLCDDEKVVVAYQFFSAIRPDIANHISPRENLSSSSTKLETRIQNNVKMIGLSIDDMYKLLDIIRKQKPKELSDILDVELKFLFDVIYTKVPIIYTLKGCVFRLISVCCSVCVLVLFFTFFSRVEPQSHYSIVDIIITCILLVGAVIVELYAIGRLVFSDWTALWVNSRGCKNNRFLRTLGSFISSLFRMRKLICQRKPSKRWSGSMGQFNLVSYCFKYKRQVETSFLICKQMQRHLHTEYKHVPERLKVKNFGHKVSSRTGATFTATRGEKALKEYEDLKWSIELDFDESIITWHLATDICYHNKIKSTEDNKEANGCFFSCFGEDKAKEDHVAEGEKLEDTCQVISNYMMYLLVMQTEMILPGYRKDFWFSRVSEDLGSFFENQTSVSKNKDMGAATLCPFRMNKKEEHKAYELLRQRMESRGALELEVNDLKPVENAWKIFEKLPGNDERWKIIEEVWLEMLCYAAIACPHVNHARQLRRGGEYLTHLWLRLTMYFLNKS